MQTIKTTDQPIQNEFNQEVVAYTFQTPWLMDEMGLCYSIHSNLVAKFCRGLPHKIPGQIPTFPCHMFLQLFPWFNAFFLTTDDF